MKRPDDIFWDLVGTIALRWWRWRFPKPTAKNASQWGIPLALWRAQRGYTQHMPQQPAAPAAKPRPLPPAFVIWMESADEYGPDLMATAADLPAAIAIAASYARSTSLLILITETATGNAWAIQHTRAPESIATAMHTTTQ